MAEGGDFTDKMMGWGYREEERAWRKEQQDWRRQDQLWRRRDMKWREEDRVWRRNDRRYRILDNLRRKVDEWVELINDVSNICALIGGFAMAVIVEAPLDSFHMDCIGKDDAAGLSAYRPDPDCLDSLPDRLPLELLTVFAISAVCTVGSMLWCSVSCTRAR